MATIRRYFVLKKFSDYLKVRWEKAMSGPFYLIRSYLAFRRIGKREKNMK